MAEPRLTFRKLDRTDVPLLHAWLERPHVAAWWKGEATPEAVREAYLPEDPGHDAAVPFLACLDDEPVGYIQYYHAHDGTPGWWPDEPPPGVLGVDHFIAESDLLGQGLGTAMVRQFTARLMGDPGVTEVRADPHPGNARAIRCYERVGFRRVDPIETPDGPALMMVLARRGTERELPT